MKTSAWQKGVALYAEELKEFLVENNLPHTKEAMLNGAQNWKEYSYGGCALIYDADIAERLCSPSELRRVTRKDGSLRQNANARENWLEVQARALHQACNKVLRQAKEASK